MGPHPAVAAIRLAVRRVLTDILDDHGRASGRTPNERPPSPLVLVACSGGADSMALASALAFEAPRLGVRAGGVTVDHGLQAGSDLRAAEVASRLRELGLDP
ncbi:tRNA lysidine(34) synthetase TilS, partial [Streptomyces sp. 13-12-16]|uniref:ATP-binding protein n=2 Tax=unclassified Streptomyces TaxID=2593676 RepID=UPI000A24F4F4